MKTVCKFILRDGVKQKWIEGKLATAIFNAECVHGKTEVRIKSNYYIPDGQACCVIDVSTEVGEHIAQVFTGLLMQEFGEEGFSVERVTK